MERAIDRIEREIGIPGLASILAERIKPTDLQTLLLHVYRIRASQKKPSQVLADFEANRFVRPSPVSPAHVLEWESLAFEHLPEKFEILELSPVTPLGTNSAVARVTQDWAVSTIRNTEVISDPTNVLALECALRRRDSLRDSSRIGTGVHLAARHRALRGQKYSNVGASTHFALLSLCSAGRDTGSSAFELSALRVHISFYVMSLSAFVGPSLQIEVSVTDLGNEHRSDLIDAQLFEPLRSNHPHLSCRFDPDRTSGRGYYSNICFSLHAGREQGEMKELVDGGCVDWTQQLLSDSKERLAISGIGSERVVGVKYG